VCTVQVFDQLMPKTAIVIAYFAVRYRSLCKRSVQSLDFTVNSFFMKLFKTSDITRECQSLFGFDPPSMVLTKRFDKFIARHDTCCMYYAHYYW